MRRTTLDWVGRDLLHLALLVSLLGRRGGGPGSMTGTSPFLVGGPESPELTSHIVPQPAAYEEALSRQKAVLDDLHDLRDDRPGGLSALLRSPGVQEISAYVLQHHLTNLQDFDAGLDFGLPSTGLIDDDEDEDGEYGRTEEDHIDSGVSDVSSETSGQHSPRPDSGTDQPTPAGAPQAAAAANEDPFSLDPLSPGAFPSPFHNAADPFFADIDLPSPLLSSADAELSLDGINPVDLVHGGGGPVEVEAEADHPVEGRDVTLASAAVSVAVPAVSVAATDPFSPDEEDVENQLMHIDDQLIRIDGSIDNIEQGVDSLSGALINEADESMMDLDLLGREDQEFLFSSLQDTWRDVTGGDDVTVATPSVQKEEDEAKPEPAVTVKEEIKEELVDEEEIEGAAVALLEGATAQDFHDSEESKLGILANFDDSPIPSHLLDHSYAASPDNEEVTSIKVEDSESEYYFSTTSSTTSSYYLGGPSDRMGHAPSPTPSSMSGLSGSGGGGGGGARRYPVTPREARDAKKARAYGIPFTLSEIIDSSMEKFNDLVTSSGLTETQMSLCRDIRRRGKNKVAAQNCRRRKMDLISNLSDEIVRAREYKQQLLAEREHLYRLRNEWSNKLLQLEESVLRGLDHNPREWELGVTSGANGSQQVRARRRGTSTRQLAKPARA